ncbi:MAG: PP0621 family protein [Pseudomonadota bacterium]
MGLRYLLLGLAIWAVWLILRHLIRQQRLKNTPPQAVKSVDSVQCSHCGLHLPRSEAIQQGDDFFCNREHQRLFKHRE